MSPTPTVLIVDDEPGLVDLYATWLDRDYTVVTAASGAEALEHCTSEIDVLLLDRRMPGMSGDDLLEAIDDLEADFRVALISAVEPGFDILELSFDAYLQKPITRKALTSEVRRLLELDRLDATVQRSYRIAAKLLTLQESVRSGDLASNAAYARLRSRLAQVSTSTERTLLDLLGIDDLTDILGPGGTG